MAAGKQKGGGTEAERRTGDQKHPWGMSPVAHFLRPHLTPGVPLPPSGHSAIAEVPALILLWLPGAPPPNTAALHKPIKCEFWGTLIIQTIISHEVQYHI